MVATKTRRAEPTEHAQAAKQIRATLKAAYPRIPFSVKSKSFSGGTDVWVHWTDGPTEKAVDAMIAKYQYGHFDGMIDLYEYSNKRADIPQVKYVMTQRGQSPEATAAMVASLNARYGWDLEVGDRGEWRNDRADAPHGWRSSHVWRIFSDLSLVCPACGSPTLPGDRFCPDCGASLPAEDR